MSKDPMLYDLVLLLATSAGQDARAKLVTEVEEMIAAAGGEVARRQDWGQRPTAYAIGHETDADYHLLQFTGPPALLETLSHSLRIADIVLRFRIIKVTPGTPAAPETAPPLLVGAADTAVTTGGGAA